LFSIIDMLGTRFDGGASPQWDLAAFCSNRRGGDLHGQGLWVRAQRGRQRERLLVRSTTPTINLNFDVASGSSRSTVGFGGSFLARTSTPCPWRRMGDHHHGGTAPAANNIELIPTAAAPKRLEGRLARSLLPHAAPQHARADQLGLPDADRPRTRRPSQTSLRASKTLGQGVWPGYRDSMRIADVTATASPK